MHCMDSEFQIMVYFIWSQKSEDKKIANNEDHLYLKGWHYGQKNRRQQVSFFAWRPTDIFFTNEERAREKKTSCNWLCLTLLLAYFLMQIWRGRHFQRNGG
jgi:hypothetical protein